LILMEEALADPEATGTGHRPLLLAYLGEAHLLAGLRDDAVTVARRALDLAHRQKERGSEAWVLRLLGKIAAHADPPDPESAEVHYTQALARAGELGMPSGRPLPPWPRQTPPPHQRPGKGRRAPDDGRNDLPRDGHGFLAGEGGGGIRSAPRNSR
jgi:hypothetical protein